MMPIIIKYFIRHKPAIILCGISFFFYSFLLVHKYVHFAYDDWDMAFFNQSLWNLLHGRLYSELYGLNTWGTHAEFMIDFAAPFLLIFPHPLTFTFIQIVLYILSGWLFYLMAQDDIGARPAFLMSAMYIFFLPNLLAMCHDHNAESLSPFFIMLAVYLFRKKRAGYYFLSLFFLLMVKENMAFVVAMLGVWGLCAKDRNRWIWGMLPLVIAIIYFVLVYAWIIPFFRGAPYTVWSRYEHLGTSKSAIFMNLLRLETWKVITSYPWNRQWFLALFSVFLLPALLSPGILILMLPIFLYHMLSRFAPETTLLNVYALSMTPAIFLASVNTFKKWQIKGALLMLICILLLVGSLAQMYKYGFPLVIKTGFIHDSNDLYKWRLINRIPKDAAVIATFEFLPALSLRENLYSFHKVYTREYQEEKQMKTSMFYVGQPPFSVPASVSYVLINYNDRWLRSILKMDGQYVEDKIVNFLRDWREIDSSGTTILYKRRGLTN